MRALVVVQGISKKHGYLAKELYEEAAGTIVKAYDVIAPVNTDQFFAKISNIPSKILGPVLSDVWNYYTNGKARREACREVRKTITELQSKGFEVDILAHSLGTVITLCSGGNSPARAVSVVNVYLLACPLGIGNLFARMKTNGHTERYSNNFVCKNLFYFWSEKDYVSKILKGRTLDILKARSVNPPITHHTGTDHASSEYLECLVSEMFNRP